MTNDQLREWLEIEAKATPGEWEVHGNPRYWIALPIDCEKEGDPNRGNNAAFVALARNNFRAMAEELIARREAMRVMVERLESVRSLRSPVIEQAIAAAKAVPNG